MLFLLSLFYHCASDIGDTEYSVKLTGDNDILVYFIKRSALTHTYQIYRIGVVSDFYRA